jgi:triacylglycerol lipase
MVATLQRITAILLASAAVGWAWLFEVRGQPAVAIFGAVAIVFAYSLFLAIEFLCLLRFGADGASPTPPMRDLLRAWAAEVFRTPAVFCWRQPFRTHAEPDGLGADVQGQRGVLLVHGFMCNRALWNPWMKRFRARGVPFVAVSLEPPFGSIDAFIPQIGVAIEQLRLATGLAPVVVAHSMGGLAVRAWMASAHTGDGVHRVVTIASPHRGTWLARFFHAPNGMEMRLRSAWLTALEARESAGMRTRFVCFYGPCDNIVFPSSTATLIGADNRRLEATAHVQMAFHPEVFEAVLETLQSESPVAVKYPEPTPASLRSTG